MFGAESNDPVFTEAQIVALQTGDIEPLRPFLKEKRDLGIAAQWTIQAVRRLHGQKSLAATSFFSAPLCIVSQDHLAMAAADSPSLDVSQEAALLLAGNIRTASVRFLAEESDHPNARKEAAENLEKLVVTIRERAQDDHNRVSLKSVTDILKKLCPLWPFCK